MSDTRTDGWNFQLTLLSFTTLICVVPYELLGLPKIDLTFEKVALYTLVGVVTLLHFHYGIRVVSLRIVCSPKREFSNSFFTFLGPGDVQTFEN